MSGFDYDHAISVMKAARDGAEIEYRDMHRSDKKWHETNSPLWDWNNSEYRIKPEPLECWAVVGRNGLYWGLYQTLACALDGIDHAHAAGEFPPYKLARMVEAEQ